MGLIIVKEGAPEYTCWWFEILPLMWKLLKIKRIRNIRKYPCFGRLSNL
jgi:hypothetical protein